MASSAACCFHRPALYLSSVEEEAYAAALCRAYNNWLYDYCGADRQRLMGVGAIPMQDINAAVAETSRAVNELGFKAIFCPAQSGKGAHTR